MTDLAPTERPDRELRIHARRGDLNAAYALIERHKPASLRQALELVNEKCAMTTQAFDATVDAYDTYRRLPT